MLLKLINFSSNEKKTNQIKMQVISLRILVLFNFFFVIRAVQLNDTDLTDNNGTEQVCLKLCGENSAFCIFRQLNSSIECVCKSGFIGKFCTQTTNDSFLARTELVWQDIFKMLDSDDFKQINMNLIEALLRKLNQLFSDFTLEKKLTSLDIYRVQIIFKNLINTNKLLLNEAMLHNILKLMDNIIYLNEIITFNSNKTYKSVLTESNQNYNHSGLALIRMFDELMKCLRFETTKIYSFNLKYFHFTVADMNPMSNQFPFRMQLNNTDEIISSFNSTLNRSLLIDSITLNESVLKRLYSNNSIRISFKIYFNKNNLLPNKLEYFKSHIQKPRNFFFELTDENYLLNHNETEKSLHGYFISSNVLSAQIFTNHPIKTSQINDEEMSKFVRIQFVVLLNDIQNEKNLKCVYWNFSSLKWLSDGCHMSRHESGQISESRLFRKVCYCNHLTNFALLFTESPLMNANSLSPLRIVFNRVLTTLTYFGIAVSSICYLVMIASRLFSQKIPAAAQANNILKITNKNLANKYRDKTLQRLYLANTVCLLFTNVFFVSILFMTPDVSLFACKLNVAGLQYFILAAFTFSLGTAYQHFQKLVRVFDSTKFCSHFTLKWFFISLIFPMVFAVLGYILEPNKKQNDLENTSYNIYCWLRAPYIYYLFVMPLTIVLIVSLAFYIVVAVKVYSIYNMCCIKAKNEQTINSMTRPNTSYNQKRVIALLTFSFVSLGLTWLLGLAIVIAAQIDENLKLAMDFLFCVFNSFHGLSLLMGHSIAHRYGKSSSYESSFTKTFLNPAINEKNNQQETRDKTANEEEEGNKLNSLSYFYLAIYGIGYAFRRIFNLKQKKNNKQLNKNKTPILEFTIGVNCEEFDSSQNFQTLQTFLRGDSHKYNEFLPSYFNSDKIVSLNDNHENITPVISVQAKSSDKTSSL